MAEKEKDALNAEAIALAENEVRIIKKAFKGNDPLLKAMRTLFFNLGATVAEKGLVRAAFADAEVLALVQRRFLPRLSKDTPIGNSTDVWLGAEKMTFAVSRDVIEQAIKYKEKAILMTEIALRLLEDPDGTPVPMSSGPTDLAIDPLAIDLLARNQYINSCDGQLSFLRLIANKEDETPIEKTKRLQKNSAK